MGPFMLHREMRWFGQSSENSESLFIFSLPDQAECRSVVYMGARGGGAGGCAMEAEGGTVMKVRFAR